MQIDESTLNAMAVANATDMIRRQTRGAIALHLYAHLFPDLCPVPTAPPSGEWRKDMKGAAIYCVEAAHILMGELEKAPVPAAQAPATRLASVGD